MPIFGQKNVNSVKFTHYDHKSEEDVLFSDISRKKNCSNAHIFSKKKNVHSLKKHCFHAHILSKKCPFFQKHCALMSIFFKIFIKNPLLSCPYLIKNVNSIKTTLYYEPKKSIWCPFFPISHGKIIPFMPIFCKKRPFSKKHAALKSRFCQKNGHSLKNTVLLCHFFKFFMTNPLLSRPYLVKKTLILSK